MTHRQSLPADEPTAAVGRRGFLTLAVAGVAASAFTVTIGGLAPAPAHANAFGTTAGTTAAAAAGPRKRELRAMWIS